MSSVIQALIDELAVQGRRPDPIQIIDEAQARGIPFTEEDIKHIFKRNPHTDYSLIAPDWLIKFVTSYVRDQKVETLLDPAANAGFLIAPIARTTASTTAYALEANSLAIEVASKLYKDSSITWVNLGRSATFQWLNEIPQSFDLIVSLPPFGLRGDWYRGLYEQSKLPDEWAHLILLNSCLKLNKGGAGIFIVPEGFLRSKVNERLESFDLHLDAVLYLPPKTFAPVTSIDTYLVIISRAKPRNLFVGELTSIEKRNQGVLKNLKARKAATTFGLGLLIDPKEFHSYPLLEAERRIQQTAQQLGLNKVRLMELAPVIRKIDTRKLDQVQEEENAIYLPARPGPVYTTLGELTAQGYFQIKFSRDSAVAGYVARLLNSSFGKLLRKKIETGQTIPYVGAANVEKLELYLPSLEVQATIVDADIKAANIINHVTELREQLWTSLQAESDATRKINELLKGENEQRQRFEEWIDCLPFPIASILWAYHATNDDFKRYRLLLRYFEALAQFFAIVLLSGFYGDPEWLSEAKDVFFEFRKEEQLENLKAASFGTWKTIIDKLLKMLHQKLSNPDQEVRCERLFAISEELLQKLFPERLKDVLAKTNSLRNEWHGHGGIDDRVATERLPKLREHLEETREILGRNWEQFRLIKPGLSRKSGGIITQNAELLMGHHNPFVTTIIQPGEVLDTNYLYLHAPQEQKALIVQPLIHVLTKMCGEQNAAYFYSRIKNDKVVFISHHFEKEPALEDMFPEVLAVLEGIRQNVLINEE